MIRSFPRFLSKQVRPRSQLASSLSSLSSLHEHVHHHDKQLSRRLSTQAETHQPFDMNKFTIRRNSKQQWTPDIQDEAEVALSWCTRNPFNRGVFQGLILLDRMTAYPDVMARPNVPSLVLELVQACSKCKSQNLTQQLTDVVRKFLTLSAAADASPALRFKILRLLLVCWTRVVPQEPGSGRIAFEILKDLKQAEASVRSDSNQYIIGTICYNQVLNMLANDGEASHALKLLSGMIRDNTAAYPDRITFHTVLKAMAKSNQDAVDQALKVVQLMLKIFEKGDQVDIEMRPDKYTYYTLLGIIANSSRRDKAQCLLHMVDQMEQLHQQNENNPRPDKKIYESLISAFVNDRTKNAGEVDHLLRRMVHAGFSPSTSTCNGVLHYWVNSRSRNAGAKAQELYQFVKQQRRDFNDDAATHTIIITGYAKEGNFDEAYAILENMVKVAEQNPERNIKRNPNTKTFGAVLQALSRSLRPDAGEMSERILLQMQNLQDQQKLDCKPDAIIFNTVLACWAKSKVKGAGLRAESILRGMDELYRAGDPSVKPSRNSYNIVLDAYASSQQPDEADTTCSKAISILHEMTELAENGDLSMRPTEKTFSTLAKLVTTGNMKNSNLKATQILSLLEKYNLKDRLPNVLESA